MKKDFHPIKWEKADYGYRGSMGDFVQLKDGSLLMSFIKDLCLVGYHARDSIHVARIGIDWFYGEAATQVSER